MSDKKQTAVEWFMEQIGEKQPNGLYVIDTLEDVKNVFEQAKQIEKEQIMEAHYAPKYGCFSEQYYKDTFGDVN
jgi:hypothetical protein